MREVHQFLVSSCLVDDGGPVLGRARVSLSHQDGSEANKMSTISYKTKGDIMRCLMPEIHHGHHAAIVIIRGIFQAR